MGMSYTLGTHAAAPRSFAERIHSGYTVYDIGANNGQMSLIFSALVGASGRVLSLEPSPGEYAQLLQNLRLNAISNVRCLEAAAADASSSVAFEYSADRPTQGKLASVEPTYRLPDPERLVVRCVTLDSLLAETAPPNVVKIDVEGAAAAVLRGSRQIIREFSPAFYLELHGPEEQAGVRDELVGKGYVAETIDGENVIDPASGWHSPLWCYRAR